MGRNTSNGGEKARFFAPELAGIEPTPPAPEEQGMPALANLASNVKKYTRNIGYRNPYPQKTLLFILFIFPETPIINRDSQKPLLLV
jgi:hypothetical protein